MAGLASIFGESYDPLVDDKPRPQHVPVRPKGELKPLDAAYYQNMPVMDTVSSLGRAFGQAIGASPTHANRMGEDTRNLIGFTPVVGDVLGAKEAKESLLSGNYGRAALQAGLTAIGVVPGIGDVAAKAGRKGLETVADTMAAAVKPQIKAYHGSPHSFDKFSLDKIGTGEGAQAYGHGLYFAENEGVAKSYRDMNKGGLPTSPYAEKEAQDWVDDADGDWEKALDNYMEHTYGGERGSATDLVLSTLSAGPPGSMYEVNIAADPAHMLDWDKPLSEQPAKVQKIFSELGSDQPISKLTDLTTPEVAAKLKQEGVPGIKFFDRDSRGMGEGTRNYVVPDDTLISIVRKYGLAAAVAGGLVTEEMARQMQEQGLGGT